MRKPTAHIIILSLLLSSSFLNAEVYKWRDSKGKLHFSDSPPLDKESIKLNEKELASRISSFTNVSVQITPIDFGVNKQVNVSTVTMYSTDRCPYCAKARAYFAANNIDYVEKNIDTSEEFNQEFKSFGGKGVPVIFSGKYRMNGFSSARFAKFYEKSVK